MQPATEEVLYGDLLTHSFYKCTNFDNSELFTVRMVEVSVFPLAVIVFIFIDAKISTIPKGGVPDGPIKLLVPRVL